jgi:hypothetical protein
MKLKELFKKVVPYEKELHGDEGLAYFNIDGWEYVLEVIDSPYYAKKIRSVIERSPEFDNKIDVDPKTLSKVWMTSPVYSVAFFQYDEMGSRQHNITGTKNALTVFSTVIDATEELVADLNARLITFSASKSEPSRVKMYQRLVSRLDHVESFTYNDRQDILFYMRMY